ncbi:MULTISPECIES: hypothetical protein [Halomicrobium]|uniref:Lipoprotein n=2 Tax=Halomicrobium mukohataei TaxID=57705 RepID=C7NXS8_HALMD|nr:MULTISPECIES: hypothetical protein [Halomicrobium]ACV46516.1 hypothetical protein Hmuk_0379 [Halomicrobium mukohataei DSM 12286]QCD65060.1 hypothetical protein E5139_05180 [Halomicrobium mukohataei]QFR19866.1 hypothetical protein GBQ70_05175 [Halomicrobium sp. ZPS1]
MVEPSRRETLAAIAGGTAAALAGCQWNAEPSDGEREQRRRVTDYEVASVRHADERALFTEGEPLSTPRESDERPPVYGHTYLTSGDDLDDVTFAETSEAERLASFAAATALDGEESVYLFTTAVRACSEVRLQWVEVDGTGPSAQFCRTLRPADVECRATAYETTGFAIRLPFAGERFSGHGAGMSSSCGRPPRPEPFDPTEGSP